MGWVREYEGFRTGGCWVWGLGLGEGEGFWGGGERRDLVVGCLGLGRGFYEGGDGVAFSGERNGVFVGGWVRAVMDVVWWFYDL